LNFDLAELQALLAEPIEFTGAARDQVRMLADRVEQISLQYPQAATYSPGGIL
jgi:adenylosuccinate lyase